MSIVYHFQLVKLWDSHAYSQSLCVTWSLLPFLDLPGTQPHDSTSIVSGTKGTLATKKKTGVHRPVYMNNNAKSLYGEC